MKYKDLIFKITSKNKSDNGMLANDSTIEINHAKKSLSKQVKSVVGILVDEETELTTGMLNSLKTEIERTLTVIFNSSIYNNIIFLPFNKNTLTLSLETFPEKNIHYISDRTEYKSIKDLKLNKLNLKMIYTSTNKKTDFIKKIDYLVTINHTLESSMESALKTNNIMVFPMNFRGTSQFTQKEKKIQPDPSGWSYNSASGMWVKNWGKDGSQTIQGW